jgi:hypothetical protein
VNTPDAPVLSRMPFYQPHRSFMSGRHPPITAPVAITTEAACIIHGLRRVIVPSLLTAGAATAEASHMRRDRRQDTVPVHRTTVASVLTAVAAMAAMGKAARLTRGQRRAITQGSHTPLRGDTGPVLPLAAPVLITVAAAVAAHSQTRSTGDLTVVALRPSAVDLKVV